MYRIEYTRGVVKSLRRMPVRVARLVRSKIEALATDPFAANNNVKALTGRPGYRLRVGDWRVIYELDTSGRILIVLAIAPRSSIYGP